MNFSSIRNMAVKYFYHQKSTCGLVKFVSCFQPKLCYIHFQYVIGQWKIIFRSQKDCIQIYLWFSVSLQKWLAIYIYHQKSTCGLTGYDCFMCHIKNSTIVTFNILYWLMENHFSEVKKASKSFTLWAPVALQIWLDIIFYHQKSACRLVFAWCF